MFYLWLNVLILCAGFAIVAYAHVQKKQSACCFTRAKEQGDVREWVDKTELKKPSK